MAWSPDQVQVDSALSFSFYDDMAFKTIWKIINIEQTVKSGGLKSNTCNKITLCKEKRAQVDKKIRIVSILESVTNKMLNIKIKNEYKVYKVGSFVFQLH